jgi:hypothetical protein
MIIVNHLYLLMRRIPSRLMKHLGLLRQDSPDKTRARSMEAAWRRCRCFSPRNARKRPGIGAKVEVFRGYCATTEDGLLSLPGFFSEGLS